MKAFLEQYGTAIFVLVVVAILVAFANPVGTLIKDATNKQISNVDSIGNKTIKDIEPLAPGLYNENNKQLYSWDQLLGTEILEGGILQVDEFNRVSSNNGEEYQISNYLNGKLVIADNVNGINNSAFKNCENLISVRIPSSIQSIGNAAFFNCTNLEQVSIPENIRSINNHTFSMCRELQSITLPENIESIGANAFYSCQSLQSINYCGTKEQWNNISKDSTWNKNSSIATIHCTDGDILI